MKIRLNGEERDCAPGSTIAALLDESGHGARKIAVEVNGAIVPKGAHATHLLAPGDRVEIVHAIGGG